jgi:hypothetical protein
MFFLQVWLQQALSVHLKQLNACVLAATGASSMRWIRFSPIFIQTRE